VKSDAGTPGGSGAAADAAHLLTFDVEEYFQVEAAQRAGVRPSDWETFPRRAAASVERLLDLLREHRTSATFFILGWLAQREADLVRRMAASGGEVASHGMSHVMLDHLTPDEFRRELQDSRKLLEDLSGRPVRGYRAPTFSITHRTAWALDVLAEAGYVYDSPIFPVRHDRYGVPEAPTTTHRAQGPGGGSVLEIPPTTMRLLGQNLPVGGGGYLRLVPIRILGRALSSLERRGHPGMVYLHPWELDPEQPVLDMGRLGTWRHRVGLGRTETKLRWLLRRFRFGSVADRLDALQASAGETFVYGRPAQP